MSVDEELLAAIAAAPDDDGPRLVYADRLSDRGDPRGELIVLQCRAAAPGLPLTEREALQTRIDELVRAHGRSWFEAYAAPDCVRPWHVSWDRGFVGGLKVFGHEFADHGAAIMAAFPTVTTLRLEPMRPDDSLPLDRVLRAPHLERLHELDLWDFRLDASQVARLAHTPSLAGLRELRLDKSRIDDTALAALAGSPLRLHALYLAWTAITDDGVAQLARSPVASQIAKLCLNSIDRVGDPAIAALAELPALARLMMNRTKLTDAGVAAIARTLRLETLDVDHRRLGPGSARALATMPTLRELYVARTSFGDEGVATLAAAPALAELRVLGLDDVALGDAAAEALVASPYLSKLERLWLRWNPRIGEAARASLHARFGSCLRV